MTDTIVKFPAGGKKEKPTKPKRSAFDKFRDLFSDLESPGLDVRTQTWLLVNLDYLPEGKDLDNLRAWLEWQLFDSAKAQSKAYEKAHKALCKLRNDLAGGAS